MPQIKNQDDLQLTSNHPGFFLCVTIACYSGNNPKQNVSIILDEILTRLVGQHCIWQKESFFAYQN